MRPNLLLLRLFSTSASAAAAAGANPLKLKNICYRHRARALKEARLALTEYLHSTRSLPFSFSDHIASNSPLSLSLLLSQMGPTLSSSPPSSFPRTLRRFLSYRPVNEFDFLFESIGIDISSPSSTPLGPFLSDYPLLLSSISALLRFGFPWTRLGILYQSNPSIFQQSETDLRGRLDDFESLGLPRVSVIAVCLAFPWVLPRDREEADERLAELLFRDLRTAFIEFDLAGDDVDMHLRICWRIRVFYDLGSEFGTMGELMGRNKKVFFDADERALARKLNFFLTLGMRKEEAGAFLLRNAELIDLDLDSPVYAMPDYLVRVGLDEEKVVEIVRKCPSIMGRNSLGNLPAALRVMNLHRWFLGRIVDDGHLHFLSPDFVSSGSHDVQIENEFLGCVERLRLARGQKHYLLDNKLEFLLSIGFGRNKITSRASGLINSTKEQLEERFECLLEMGIEYPMLCRMITASPKVLNNCPESLHEKVDYLCNELGYPLEYLAKFPAFFCFDLENRTKPRYRILNWLKENGLLSKPFAPATVLANSEKRFIVQLFSVHPAAPKQWLECFSSRCDSNGYQRNLFAPRPVGTSES